MVDVCGTPWGYSPYELLHKDNKLLELVLEQGLKLYPNFNLTHSDIRKIALSMHWFGSITYLHKV